MDDTHKKAMDLMKAYWNAKTPQEKAQANEALKVFKQDSVFSKKIADMKEVDNQTQDMIDSVDGRIV